MRSSILMLVLILPLLAVAACADNLTLNSNVDSFGFSSDESGGTSYLGVDTRDITADRLGALHLKEEHGVEVTMVDQDAPAGKAGLKEQDVILTLNGAQVESVEQLRRMIRETPPGRVVTLGVSRNGQPMTVKVQLADRKSGFGYGYGFGAGSDAKNFHFEMPTLPTLPEIDVPVSIVVVHSSARSGLMVENLTPQLGDFFGAKNGQGVLVRSVEKGSRADKAGFRAGDVIVKINGEPIHDSGDFSHALRGRKDNSATISILRDKKEQTITLTLPERKEGDLFWESLDAPEINAQAQEELSKLQCEVARLRDEAVNGEMKQLGREMEQEKRETLKQKEKLQKQMRDMQRQYQDQQRETIQKLKEELRDLENEF